MLKRGDIFCINRKNCSTRIIVILLDTPMTNYRTVKCMVIGGNDPTYPVGGYDLAIFLEDLTDRIDINTAAVTKER